VHNYDTIKFNIPSNNLVNLFKQLSTKRRKPAAAAAGSLDSNASAGKRSQTSLLLLLLTVAEVTVAAAIEASISLGLPTSNFMLTGAATPCPAVAAIAAGPADAVVSVFLAAMAFETAVNSGIRGRRYIRNRQYL